MIVLVSRARLATSGLALISAFPGPICSSKTPKLPLNAHERSTIPDQSRIPDLRASDSPDTLWLLKVW